MPESFYIDPLMYQARQRRLSTARAIRCAWPSEAYGIDLEAEVVVVTDDVPMAVTPEQAAGHIQLIGLINDVSLRNLIPGELAKGFGFLQSKPRSALSPGVRHARTNWATPGSDSKVHLPLLTHINGDWFGAPEAGVDMQFNFAQLIAHAAKTRPLSAGTIVGSGTVANEDTSLGRLLLRRTAHRGNPARRQAEHAVHEVRRRGAHRDARSRRRSRSSAPSNSGWRLRPEAGGQSLGRSNTSTSARLPCAIVTSGSSCRSRASPAANLRSLTVTSPRATCT